MSDGFRTSDVSYVGRPKRVGCPTYLTSLCTSGVISKILLSDVRQGSDVRHVGRPNFNGRPSFLQSLCKRLDHRLHHQCRTSVSVRTSEVQRCRTSEMWRTSEVLLLFCFSSLSLVFFMVPDHAYIQRLRQYKILNK